MTKKIQKKTSGKHAKIHSTTPGELSVMISNVDDTNFAVMTSEGFDIWLYDQTGITIQFKILSANDELKLTINSLNNVTLISTETWTQNTESIDYDFEYTSNDNSYWIGFDLSASQPGDIGGGIAMVGTVSMIVPK